MASQPLPAWQSSDQHRLVDYYLARKRVIVWLLFAVVCANTAVIVWNVAWLAAAAGGSLHLLLVDIQAPAAVVLVLSALKLPAVVAALGASVYCGVKAWRSRQSAKKIAAEFAQRGIDLTGSGAAEKALRLARTLPVVPPQTSSVASNSLGSPGTAA